MNLDLVLNIVDVYQFDRHDISAEASGGEPFTYFSKQIDNLCVMITDDRGTWTVGLLETEFQLDSFPKSKHLIDTLLMCEYIGLKDQLLLHEKGFTSTFTNGRKEFVRYEKDVLNHGYGTIVEKFVGLHKFKEKYLN